MYFFTSKRENAQVYICTTIHLLQVYNTNKITRHAVFYSVYGIYIYVYMLFFLFSFMYVIRDLITPAWAGTYGLCKRRNICCKLHFSLFFKFSRFNARRRSIPNNGSKKKKKQSLYKNNVYGKNYMKGKNYNLANDLKHD